MVGSELISSTAAFIDIFATLPLIVPNAKIDPMCTLSGFDTVFENEPIKRMVVDKGTSHAKFILVPSNFWNETQWAYLNNVMNLQVLSTQMVQVLSQNYNWDKK